MRKKFVAIEGVDGCGKTTLIQKMKKAWNPKKGQALYIKQPGETPIGCDIRRILLDSLEDPPYETERLLFAADHAATIHWVNKQEAEWVISDRSSWVSERVYGMIDPNTAKVAEDWPENESFLIRSQQLLPPIQGRKCMLVVLKLSEEELARRHKLLEKDRFNVRSLEYFQLVNKRYAELKFDVDKYFSAIKTFDASGPVDGLFCQIIDWLERWEG